MELKEIEAIKEGSFKKITVQYFHQEKESQINCIVLGLTDDSIHAQTSDRHSRSGSRDR